MLAYCLPFRLYVFFENSNNNYCPNRFIDNSANVPRTRFRTKCANDRRPVAVPSARVAKPSRYHLTFRNQFVLFNYSSFPDTVVIRFHFTRFSTFTWVLNLFSSNTVRQRSVRLSRTFLSTRFSIFSTNLIHSRTFIAFITQI